MLSKKSPDRTFQKKNKIGGENVRTCLHKKCVRIFEHNFVADKAKIRRRAVARQGFLTQSAAKFAEKTYAYAYEDRFSDIIHINPQVRNKAAAFPPADFLHAFLTNKK